MNIELKPIAESKVRQLGGDVFGVLVRIDEKLAAVDEHGRTTWLGDEALFDSIKQRADAWLGLVELLNDLTPEWRQHPGTGRESAFAAIRGLAQAASAQGGQGAELIECIEQNDTPSLRVAVNSLIESARCLAGADSQESVDYWAEKVGFYRDQIYGAAPQPAVPEGWKLVPVEPQPEMLIAAQRVIYSYDLRLIYGAMLAASPTPTTPQADGCPECGSTDLTWHTQSSVTTGTPDGKLRANEVSTLFVLGCNHCSETIKTLTADQVAENMSPLPPAGQEGEGDE